MKKLIFAATALLLAMTGCKQSQTSNVAPAIPADPEIEKNVQNWIKKMTLEEKVGQMLELNLDLFGANIVVNEAKVDRNKLKAILKQYNQGNPEEIDAVLAMTDQEISERFAPYGLDIYEGSVERKWVLDEAKLEEVISKYKVGSILNAPGHALTPEHWSEIIPKINEISMKHLGIPCIFGLDNNHGVTYVAGGTLFPQSINVAASFNTDLAYMASEICAAESRAADCPWVYNPTIDLGRDPRWSRIWESYGEDAIVTSRMVEAAVRGYQGPDNNHIDGRHVATSVKHYFAYGAPWSGKDRTPAYVSPQLLREKYFEPFKCAIQAGAMTIMVNSASINGVPVHASSEYLTKWLKEGLNWDGMIVTDWADINNLFQREKVAKDKKDAIRLAINAGIDMSMDPYSTDFCDLLIELVNEGQVPMSRIDDAVSRILRLKYRLGLFDTPDTKLADYPDFGAEEYAEKSLRAAEETEVLLKNEGALPIAQGKKILVAGPNANQIRCLNGGWSYTWQGTNDPKFVEQYNTIYEALSNKFGAGNVILEQGVTYNERGSWWSENEPEIQKAVAAASRADIIVACIGENSYCETPGNLTDLTLSENQRNLVKALSKTGKPIVLIINGGRPRIIADIEPLANAVVDILLPGNYGADALANLLAGDANFSAKMPYTYPKEINSLINYDFKVSEQVNTMAGAYDYDAKVVQQWGFGYGLSYTTYAYSKLSADKVDFKDGDEITFSVDVTNTGRVAGKEPVLLYSSDLVASIVPDSRRLRAFTKVALEPGETKTVSLTIKASDLAFVGADGKWILEEGDFNIQVGDQAVTVSCTETKKYENPNK